MKKATPGQLFGPKPKKTLIQLEEALMDYKAKAALNIDKIYLPLNHIFNQASKRAFQTSVDKTMIERTKTVITDLVVEVLDEVRYFGSTAVGECEIFDAAQKVASQVNEYADQGFVTGVLGCPLIMLKLATEPHELEKYAVLSYVALSPEGIKYLKDNPSKVEFNAGTIPTALSEQ